MPNQINFRSDITTQTEPTFFASRVVKNLEEGVLLEELPGSFGFSEKDTIEIHFYTLDNNVLMLSTRISMNDSDPDNTLQDILKSHVVRYNDGSYKTYIRIDFTLLFKVKQILLIPGEYKVVFNFFMNEIGDYNDRNLFIEEISPSKTEVQLAFLNNGSDVLIQQNQQLLDEFIPKYLTKPLAVALAEKTLTFGITSDDPLEGVNYDRIVDNINFANDGLQTRETTINRIQQLGEQIEQDTKNKINQFILDLFPIVRERIVINSDERIQEREFNAIIAEVVRERFPLLQASINDKIILQ